MKLPQELFADELWGEWFYNYGVIQKAKIPEMLKKYNLKLRKDKTINDIDLILGRAFKDCPHIREIEAERIAEEVDKVCTIANWEDAVIRYKLCPIDDLDIKANDLEEPEI